MPKVESEKIELVLKEPETLRRMAGVVQELAPSLTVEQSAFEYIHFRTVPLINKSSEIIDMFTSEIIEQRQVANKGFPKGKLRKSIALDIAWSMEEYAIELNAKYPDNWSELNRRLDMWILTLGLHVPKSKEAIEKVKSDWTQKTRPYQQLARRALLSS